MIFLCCLILWIFFCEIIDSTYQFEIIYFTSFSIAIGFLLICSDFMLWQQKLTLACVPTSSLAWCEGSSVFLLLSRLSSTIFHCTQFVHATYDISVLFQMSCHWSGNRCLTLQFNGMILVHSCFFFCWLGGYADQCRIGFIVILSLNVSISWTALSMRNAWHIFLAFF